MTGCEWTKCTDYKNGECHNQLDYVNKDSGEPMCPFNLNAIPKDMAEENCPSCRAMRNRLISIVKGTMSVKVMQKYDDHDDDECFMRNITLIGIQQIADGSHSWKEALPYKPIGDEELSR